MECANCAHNAFQYQRASEVYGLFCRRSGLVFCVRVCEVLAVTWQTRQGGAARVLLIIVGCPTLVSVREAEREGN